jgi:hypothetical protein
MIQQLRFQPILIKTFFTQNKPINNHPKFGRCIMGDTVFVQTDKKELK